MKPIKDNLTPIIKKIFAKQHPLLPEIMLSWQKIVGAKFSTSTNPLKITTTKEKGCKVNILHIQAKNHAIGMEISFQQEIIIERIAVYLGFKAIHNVRVTVYDRLRNISSTHTVSG